MLVYEYMPQGPLILHLFEWAVAGGVEYLHSLARTSFIHRDLKPSNILLGDDMRAKVYNYVRIRQQMRQQAHESGDSPAIPITVRQLEAIIRLSESIEKMQLSTVATEEHVTEALRLFNVSAMDAARSGIAEQISLTPEMRSEIQQVETQIKRRMGIGINVSERRLIDDMVRMGLNESTVRRALLIMHQRDEVEYKRERRVIVRKV